MPENEPVTLAAQIYIADVTGTMVNLYKQYFQFRAIHVLLLLAISSCGRQQTSFRNPPAYDLNNSYVIKLPSELKEISGMAYYSKDNSLFAESDEKGCLYKIFLNKPNDIRKWKFSHKRDYEDVVLVDSVFYMLCNNGDIVALRFIDDSLTAREYTFPKQGKNEFESLYYDDTLKKLVLICKECEGDDKAVVGAYSLDLQQYMYNKAFAIDVQSLDAMIGPVTKRIKPSAATINPVTGQLYILSSINKLLIVASRNGVIDQVYSLNPSIFNQPEGIAFTPNGNLFISNEATEGRAATIMFYKLRKADAK